MKSHDIFHLVTRIVGFLALLLGLQNIVEGLMISTGFAEPSFPPARYWFARGFIKIAVGTYLMVGIKPFINQMFSARSEATTSDPDTPKSVRDPKSDGRPMEPKAVFAVIVKVIGLLVVLHGLEYLVESFMYSLTVSQPNTTSDQYWFVLSVIQVGAGLALMRGLVPVTRFAFPEEAEGSQRNETGSQTDGNES